MADPIIQPKRDGLSKARHALDAMPHSLSIGEGTGPSSLESASATFQLHNTIGSTLTFSDPRLNEQTELSREETGFNPYAFYSKHEQDFSDLKRDLQKGRFEHVASRQGFKAMARRIRKERRLRDAEAQADGWGMALGMGMSLADPALAVPLAGAMGKGNTLLNMVKGAGIVGGTQAAQEVMLHEQQELRTARESYMYTGFAAALGAGIPALIGVGRGAARATSRGAKGLSEVRDAYRKNFRPGFKHDGESMGEAFTARRAAEAANDAPPPPRAANDPAPPGERSAGAAESGYRNTDDIPVSRSRDWVNRMGDKVRKGDALTIMESAALKGLKGASSAAHALRMNALFGTPSRRAPHWVSERMRSTVMRMMDWGGVTTKVMENGQAVEKVAEDLKEAYYQEFMTLQTRHTDELSALNHELGGSKNEISQGFKATRARIKAFGQDLRGKDSDGTRYNAIEAWEFASVTRKALFDEIDDPAYRKELAETFGDHAVEPIVSRAKTQAERIQQTNLAQEAKAIELGMLKPEQAMGRNYRHAQLWNPDLIGADEAAFKQFIREILAGAPTAKWLDDTYGMTDEQFAKLGREDMTLKAVDDEAEPVKLSAEEGATLKDEILDDWVGGSRQRAVDDLEAKARAADEAAEVAKTDALQALYKEMRTQANWTKSRIKEAAEGVRFKQTELRKSRDELERVRVQERELQTGQFKIDPKEAKGRMVELGRRRAYLQRKITQDEARLGKIETRLHEAKANKAKSKSLSDEAKRLKTQSRKDQRKLSRTAQRLRKKVRKEGAKPPINEAAEEMVRNMRGSKTPLGILDDEVFESGRTRTRKINLTTEQRRLAEDKGWLRSDLYAVLDRQYQDMSARIGLRETYGTDDWKLVNKEVQDEYNDLIAKAQRDGASEKQIGQLRTEAAKAEKDIEGLWFRLMGRYMLPGNEFNGLHWGAQNLRTYNFLRFGAGFLLASTTDLANMSLQLGMGNTIKSLSRLTKSSDAFYKSLSNDEIRDFVVASERLMHNSRQFKVSDVGQLGDFAGTGTHGSKTRTATQFIDRANTGMAEKVNVISGMAAWNTRLKALAMDLQTRELTRRLGHYDELLAAARGGDKKATQKVAEMASLGIGETQAARIRKVLDDARTDEGVLDITKLRELDPEAYRYVFSALRRTADRAIMTPGIGDTPLLMSNGIMKTLMQFQTFGYTSVNRFITPAIQKAVTYEDMNAYLSMSMAAALGGMVVLAKDALRGEGIRERTPSQWAYDILDRSGYLAWSSPYTSSAYQMLFDENAARYRVYTNWWQVPLGPSVGTATEVGRLPYYAQKGDVDQVGNTALRMLPYSNVWRTAATVGSLLDGDTDD